MTDYKAAEASVDTNFFNLFDYRLVGCHRDRVLENEDEVILTETFARKCSETKILSAGH